jgi:hypothetical protein
MALTIEILVLLLGVAAAVAAVADRLKWIVEVAHSRQSPCSDTKLRAAEAADTFVISDALAATRDECLLGIGHASASGAQGGLASA